MVHFKTVIKQFQQQGEKTGWTYIEIPTEAVAELKPSTKTSFRVKGRLDAFAIEKVALLPMGGGKFILTLNAAIRKGVKKSKGAALEVWLEADASPLLVDSEFLDCLADEPLAAKTFESLTKSHQLYFSKWIESAKTEQTRTRRIAQAVNALSKGWGYPEMLRAQKSDREKLGL